MIRALVVLTVFALGCWSLNAQGQVKLAHQLPDGTTSTTVTKIKTDQTLSIAAMDVVTGARQELTVRSQNGQRAADGTLAVRHKIEQFKAEIDVAGQQLSFDSNNPDAPPPGTAIDVLLDVFKALSKSEWTVVHGADNRVISVKDRDKALQGLPEAIRQASQKQFDAEYLQQQANDELSKIPNRTIEPADTWDLQSTIRLDAGQTFTFDTTYTYEGVVEEDGKQLHKITEKVTAVEYDMDEDSPSPLKYVKSDLQVPDSRGTILFDNQAGQVISASSKVHIAGSMTFEAGGNELPARLDLTLETSSNTVANR